MSKGSGVLMFVEMTIREYPDRSQRLILEVCTASALPVAIRNRIEITTEPMVSADGAVESMCILPCHLLRFGRFLVAAALAGGAE